MAYAGVEVARRSASTSRRANGHRQDRLNRKPRVLPKSEQKTVKGAAKTKPDEDLAVEERMLVQLRDFIIGPEAKTAEARYEEFLNILAEQKESAEIFFNRFDENFRASMSETAAQFSQLDQALRILGSKVDTENQAIRQSVAHSIEKLHEEQAAALQKFMLATERNFKGLEIQFRMELAEVSESFSAYVNASTKRREDDIASVMATIQNYSSDMRREFTDIRQRDINEIGVALAEIGSRLMDQSRS
jgi:hypothetical protein